MLENPNKIVGMLTIGSFVGLFIFGMMGFFIEPHYKPMVETVSSAFKDAFLLAAGVKAGLSLPQTAPPPTPPESKDKTDTTAPTT